MRNEGDKKLALEPLGHDERFRVQILAGGNLQRTARHLLRGRHLHVAQSVDLQVDAQYVRLFHRLAQQSRAPVGMRNSGVMSPLQAVQQRKILQVEAQRLAERLQELVEHQDVRKGL